MVQRQARIEAKWIVRMAEVPIPSLSAYTGHWLHTASSHLGFLLTALLAMVVRHGCRQFQPVQLVVVVIVVYLEVVELHGLLVVQFQLISIAHVVLHVVTDVPT